MASRQRYLSEKELKSAIDNLIEELNEERKEGDDGIESSSSSGKSIILQLFIFCGIMHYDYYVYDDMTIHQQCNVRKVKFLLVILFLYMIGSYPTYCIKYNIVEVMLLVCIIGL